MSAAAGPPSALPDANHERELRLLLEEICCNLVRFEHVAVDGIPFEALRIHQEVNLGRPGSYADARVSLPGRAPYFIEVKWRYPAETLVAHLARKYGPDSPGTEGADRLVLVVDRAGRAGWESLEALEPAPKTSRRGDGRRQAVCFVTRRLHTRSMRAPRSSHPARRRPPPLGPVSGAGSKLRQRLRPGLVLEIWDEDRLRDLIHARLGLDVASIEAVDIVELRVALDRVMGRHAFGDGFSASELETALLWHFGFWKLRQITRGGSVAPRAVLPPGTYRNVAVVFADLSSFSSYVRDTRDDSVVRHALTSFYSKARYQVLDAGGMMYQFLGDGALALFGLPHATESYVDDALACARALLDVGASVMHEWQRHIDQIQAAAGAHIGMALGDVNIVSLRPFGRAHVGAIAECVNLAARLSSTAGPREIVCSNALYRKLSSANQASFAELEPVEARNVGRIRAWKYS